MPAARTAKRGQPASSRTSNPAKSTRVQPRHTCRKLNHAHVARRRRARRISISGAHRRQRRAVGRDARVRRGESKDCLASLRATAWHAQTERALKNHPFVKAAERGRLPFQALQRFVGEQRFIQANDAASFAQLAGSDWRPTAAGLLDLWRNAPPDNFKGLFGTLLKGELAAAPLLQRLIHATGLDYDAHGRSEDGTFFAPEPRAQAYGAYWALLVPVWKSPCSMAWSFHAVDATFVT